MSSSSISIRIPGEALDLINKARQVVGVDEKLSSYMVKAADEQAKAILAEYKQEKKKTSAYAKVPGFPDFVGPFPSGGEKRMVHIAILDWQKDRFKKVATLLNQNATQFIVLSSVLRSLKILHGPKRKRRSKPTATA